DRYLQRSVILAQKQNNGAYLAISYTFIGIVRSEQKSFQMAEENFNKAFDALQSIADEKMRISAGFNVTGYYARSQMLAGNVTRAIELYKQTLDLGQKANVQDNLALGQVHQGLGECLMAQGSPNLAQS